MKRCSQLFYDALLRVGPCTAISRRTAAKPDGIMSEYTFVNAVPISRTPRWCARGPKLIQR